MEMLISLAGITGLGLAGLLGLLAIPVIYLLWQARIDPLPYEQAFEIRHDEPLRLERGSGGEIVLVSEGGPAPLLARLSAGPDAPPAEPIALNGTRRAVLPAPESGARPYVWVQLADGSERLLAERLLPLAGTDNLRDVGGYAAQDGRRVRWGLLYRSDHLGRLAPQDHAYLEGLGVRLVIDLRSAAEAARHPDRLPPSIEYWHLPIFEQEPMSRVRVLVQRHRVVDLWSRVYTEHIIDRGARAYGALLRRLSEPGGLPAVIHCTAGKDRTGVAIALILMLLGVPDDVIVGDYSLSNRSAPRWIEEARGQINPRHAPGLRVEQLYPLLGAPPVILENALAHLRGRYGSVEGYLTGPAGLTPADLERLRAALLEPVADV
ncbi:MAG: hypothetical protein Kow00124_30420 [Anaerolineae bacterium]